LIANEYEKYASMSRAEEEKYLSIIKENSKGILRDLLTIGKWKNSENSIYYFAIGAKIE